MTARLEIYTLGGLRFLLDGDDFKSLDTRKVEALAVYLAATRRPQPREVLADLLWDDRSQSRALSNLRVALTNLRKHLGPYFAITRDNAALNLDADVWLDVTALASLVAGGGAGDEQTSRDSIERLEAGVALYQGEFLQGFSVRGARLFEEWVTVEREQMHHLVMGGSSQIVEWYLVHGEYAAGIRQATRWLQLDPLNEAAHRTMMRLLAYDGQIGAAVRQYQECVRILDEELGLTPSQKTAELYEAIQAGNLVPPERRAVAEAVDQGELPPEPGEPPFKGLAYYDVDDAHLFFGREELTARLAGRLKQNRFLAVVGASGSGKSSLVRAGLLPALSSGQTLADGSSPPRGSKTWLVHLITPTAQPLKALALSLTREEASAQATTVVMDDLIHEPRSLDIHAEKLLAETPAQRLLLVVDQFEELFTLCWDEDERRAFVDNLLTTVTGSPRGATSVVITLRADFYAHCARYDGLRELLETHQIYIGQMTAGELRQAIEGPAESEGWTFEPGLVDLLLHDVGAGRNRKPEPGALPLLSHALLETWRRRRGREMTFSAYAETGGVRRAISRTAEAVFNDELAAEQRPIARSIFLRLTELGEGAQDTRRRATMAELIRRPDEATAVEEVLKTLTDARLVTTGEEGVEVAHEALIREWPRLNEWLAEDREGLRLHRHLTDAAQGWEALGRDEGALYRGARLAQAGEWAESHGDELNTLERGFLVASLELARREEAEREAQRQRELEAARNLAEAEKRRAEEQAQAAWQLRRRRRYLIGALALALVLALAAVFFGYQARDERNQAQERARLAQLALANQLALQAQDELVDFPQRSLLLAVESLQATSSIGEPRTAEAEQALRDVLAAFGGQVLPGVDRSVDEAAFSPDGRWLALSAVGESNILWLWDLVDADRLSYQFEIDTSSVPVDGGFSPDGRWFAWNSADYFQFWDLESANPADDFIIFGDSKAISLNSRTIFRIRSIDYEPDRQWLATAGNNFDFIFSAELWLWDLSKDGLTSPFLQLQIPGNSVRQVLFSPDGRWLISFGVGQIAGVIEEGDLPRLWDLQAEDLGANSFVLSTIQNELVSTTLSDDSRWLAAGDTVNSVYLWDLTLPNPAVDPLILQIEDSAAGQNPAMGVSWLAFTHDNRYLFARSGGAAWHWDLQVEGQAGQANAFQAAQDIIDSALSPDDRWLVTVDDLGELLLWDLSAPDPTAKTVKLNDDDLPIVQARFSDDGRWLVAQVAGNVTQIWDLSDPDRLKGPITLGGHEGRVVSVTISPDSQWLLTADEETTVRLWDLDNLQTGSGSEAISGHQDEIKALATSPDGNWLASGSVDGEIRLWEMDGEVPPDDSALLPGHEAAVTALAFTADGRWLLSGSEDNAIRLWDLESNDPFPDAALFGKHENGITALAISPDDKWLVTAGSDGSVWRWDLELPGEWVALPGHHSGIEALAISPDGVKLAVGGADGTAWMWDLTADEPTFGKIVFPGHIQAVTGVAFTPEGNRLATGSLDRTIRLWDLTAEDPTADPIDLKGHSDVINALAISLDGDHLVTAGGTFLDNTGRLWDLTADEPAAQPVLLPDQETEATAMAITADSRWLVLGGEDGRLRFWPLKIDDLIENACRAAGRNLSLAEWELFFPGDSYRQTCPEWPAAKGVAVAEPATQEAVNTSDE